MALGLAGVLLLGGCFESLGLSGDALQAPRVVRVADGTVAVAGPRGYCIDPVGTRDGGDTAFVLLGSCALLNGTSGNPHPDRLAVLTASVTHAPGGPAVAESLDDLAEWFATPAGRARLARDGRDDSVEVLDVTTKGRVLHLHLRDTSDFAGPAVSATYRRAVMDVGDSIVMLSVLPLDTPGMDDAQVTGLLADFIERIRRENLARLSPGVPHGPGFGPAVPGRPATRPV